MRQSQSCDSLAFDVELPTATFREQTSAKIQGNTYLIYHMLTTGATS